MESKREALSQTISPNAAILRDGAEFIIGPRFARTRWRLFRMRLEKL
jgi:hypothetical protein